MKHMTALAAVVVALFVAGSPAAADAGWERIPCFSGAIERAEVIDDDLLKLTGYLDCGVPEGYAGPRWGYAVFVAGLPYGSLKDADLRAYSYVGKTAFDDKMRVDRLPELGICVVTDYQVRIACVKVSRKSSTSPMLVGPAPVEDELFDRPLLRRSEGGTQPVCGHC